MSDAKSRRTQDRRDEEERRKIPRFTDHDIVSNLTHMRLLFKVLLVISIVFAISEVGFSYYEGSSSYTSGFVWAMAFAILAFFVKRAYFVVNLYLENHSVKNLERVHESFAMLFTYVTFLVVLVFIVRLVIRV